MKITKKLPLNLRQFKVKNKRLMAIIIFGSLFLLLVGNFFQRTTFSTIVKTGEGAYPGVDIISPATVQTYYCCSPKINVKFGVADSNYDVKDIDLALWLGRVRIVTIASWTFLAPYDFPRESLSGLVYDPYISSNDGYTISSSITWIVATYHIDLIVTDFGGNIVKDSVDIIIKEKVAPVITLKKPVGGTSYIQGDLVPIQATVADADGDLTKIDIFATDTNGQQTLLKEDLYAGIGYALVFSTVTAEIVGNIDIKIVAMDVEGKSSIAVASVIVEPRPEITIGLSTTITTIKSPPAMTPSFTLEAIFLGAITIFAIRIRIKKRKGDH